MNRTTALRSLIAAAVLGAGLWACGELVRAEGDACEQGSDCLYPAVCCTKPRIPAFGAPIPLCESIRYCDAYLPFLPEGSPCERSGTADAARPLEQCAAPLICCPTTRTCLTESGCAEAPEPIPVVSSERPCSGDPDCAPGEICRGIHIRQRKGTCRALVEAPPMSPEG